MSLTYAQLIDGSVVSISFGAGTQSSPSLYYSVDTTTGIFFPGTGTLALTTSGTEKVRITSTGNVGINITSPSVPLHLNAGTTSGTSFDAVYLAGGADGSAGSGAKLWLGAGTAIGSRGAVIEGVCLNVDNAHALAFHTNSNAAAPTERARIDSSGRLLVGTSSVQVVGTDSTSIQLQGTNSPTSSISLVRHQANSGAPKILLGKSRGASTGSFTSVISGDSLGIITFYGADGTTLDSAGAQIHAEVDGTPGTNDMPGRLVFSTTADGASSPTERMRIDSSGRLGIGMTPANALDVTGNVGVGLAGSTATAYLHLAAGGTAAGTSPLKINSGSLLTVPEVGTTEYDGNTFYHTSSTTTGRGQAIARHVFRLTAAGSALGPAIADYFGATSSINLVATSVYEIEYFLYFTKTTAGTVTFTLNASSAPTGIFGTLIGSPATGVGSGAPQTGYTASQAATTAAFPATASLTTAVNHAYTIRSQIITNAATTFKVQVTSSLGTVTPLAGSFYCVRRVSSTTGNFS